jgi:hypothetical protein
MVIDTLICSSEMPENKRAHVVDGIDGNTGHADITPDARVIGIVAAVCRQIEGDGKSLLTGGDVAAIKGVRILGGREACVLADGPRLRDVHCWVGAAQIGRDARVGVEEVETSRVGTRVDRLHADALRRGPGRR